MYPESPGSVISTPLSEDGISLFGSQREGSMSPTASAGNFTQDVVKKENRMVTLVKTALILILMAAACSTTFLTYKFTRDSEQLAFDEAFEGVATKLAPGLVAEINLRVSHSCVDVFTKF